MGIPVVAGGICQCTMGTAPTPINVLPTSKVFMPSPMACIMDNKPFLNIIPFGLCTSILNPAVAAATAAALGVLTPMPCIPVIQGPWLIGCPKMLLSQGPALTNDSMLICSYAGVIKINFPGQVAAMA